MFTLPHLILKRCNGLFISHVCWFRGVMPAVSVNFERVREAERGIGLNRWVLLRGSGVWGLSGRLKLWRGTRRRRRQRHQLSGCPV